MRRRICIIQRNLTCDFRVILMRTYSIIFKLKLDSEKIISHVLLCEPEAYSGPC